MVIISIFGLQVAAGVWLWPRVVLISKEEGGFLGSIRRSEELAVSQKGVFLPKQFSNLDNVEAHYRTTGPEIWWQCMRSNESARRAATRRNARI